MKVSKVRHAGSLAKAKMTAQLLHRAHVGGSFPLSNNWGRDLSGIGQGHWEFREKFSAWVLFPKRTRRGALPGVSASLRISIFTEKVKCH